MYFYRSLLILLLPALGGCSQLPFMGADWDHIDYAKYDCKGRHDTEGCKPESEDSMAAIGRNRGRGK